MARTIAEIQAEQAAKLEELGLSASKASEWQLWTYVVATAIHAFELILDMFRTEIEEVASKIAGGTERWYAEMCYRFQNGYKLLFDDKTAEAYYAEDDPAARIIKVARIAVAGKKVFTKVAKLDDQGKIVPLSADEAFNFEGYMASIKPAGDQIEVVSTTADVIRYDMEVFYDPSVPRTTVQQNVTEALEAFKTSLSFDGMLYAQQLIDAVMAAEGVVTVDLRGLSRQGADTLGGFVPVGVMSELQSGYFEYDENGLLDLTSVKANR